MEDHYDDYYFCWISDAMDDFPAKMEDALEKGVLPR